MLEHISGPKTRGEKAGAPPGESSGLHAGGLERAGHGGCGPQRGPIAVETEIDPSDEVDYMFQNWDRKDAREATRLYELFLVSGADLGVAKCKIAELYSPPRVTKELERMPHLPLSPGTTFDLRGDSSGRRWDFLKESDRREARRRIREERPYLVIGSPPCTDFCNWTHAFYKHLHPSEVQRRQCEARVLLNFALEVYAMQLAGAGTSCTNIRSAPRAGSFRRCRP